MEECFIIEYYNRSLLRSRGGFIIVPARYTKRNYLSVIETCNLIYSYRCKLLGTEEKTNKLWLNKLVHTMYKSKQTIP